MLERFRSSGLNLQEQVYQPAHELDKLHGDVTNRLQQVEQEYARIRLQRILDGIHEAAELSTRQGLMNFDDQKR
jgi:hypothetical protein